ncbi:MAG TPA: phage tail protein [Vicinamibacterales bacterium]|jgi:phage tail-like protein|nr:phage tail protein [Vicinamibacterales bacterium]
MRDADPYGAFRFRVEILGLQVGGFTEVAGIEREVQTEDFREGGRNDYTHKLATVTKYQNLSLKRGLADATDLWQWHQDVVHGKIERRQVTIVLLDIAGRDTWRWVIEQAYPVKWSGAAFNATTNAVLVESVELAHNGIRRG